MLYIAGLIRVIIAFIACFSFKLPLWLKYLIIFYLDHYDFNVKDYTITGEYINKNDNNLEYIIVDKIVDSICYIFLLISSKKQVSSEQYKILSYFLLYRIIGVILYILTKYEDLLILFPNVFFELALAFCLFPKTNNNILIAIVSLIKICHEIYLHSPNMKTIIKKHIDIKKYSIL